jgi:replicative DNA helicase
VATKEVNRGGLIVVDYVQLVQAERQRLAQQQLGEVTRGLKNMARELHIPVLALAQLNRVCDEARRQAPPAV